MTRQLVQGDGIDSQSTAALFVVATPIGNLEDISTRALRTLGQVDWIACEDTRRTGKMLQHFAISSRLISYHEHNEDERCPALVEKLKRGGKGALVSDAGTPLLSDPGYRLVAECRRCGLEVLPIPGPSAAIAALSVSGLPCGAFRFVGFLPKKPSAQKSLIAGLVQDRHTLIFYLSPHGLAQTLGRIAEGLGPRRAFLAREMTKLHETYRFGPLNQLLEEVERQPPKGEYTLVVEGSDASSSDQASETIDIAAYVAGLASTRRISLNEAIKIAASDLRMPKREVYRIVHR